MVRLRHYLYVEQDRRQVTEMVAPRLSGGRMQETVVRSPSRRQVEEAVLHLDGEESSDLYLYRYSRSSDAETFLGICGGAGRYFVGISDHAERVGRVLNTKDLGDVQECVRCGGEPTSFPRRFPVDLQTAITATMHYLDTGQADPTLSWDLSAPAQHLDRLTARV